jgi:hypothetical protein
MSGPPEADAQIRRGPVRYVIAGITLALGLSTMSCGGWAAGPAGTRRSAAVGAFLASSDVLSEAVMARQTGTGLGLPAVLLNPQNADPRVLLWDELKIKPAPTPVPGGVTVGGSAR